MRKAFVKQLKYAISKASGLGLSYRVMHAKSLDNALSLEQGFEAWKKVLGDLVKHAEEHRYF